MPKVLGITDENTTCECCGKTGLKRTVALEFEHDIRYFGVDCAAMAVHGRKSSANVRKITIAADNYVREQALIAKSKTARVRHSLNDALYAYIGTNRQMDNRAHYSRSAEHVVVDMADATDRAWFESNGFTCVNVFSI